MSTRVFFDIPSFKPNSQLIKSQCISRIRKRQQDFRPRPWTELRSIKLNTFLKGWKRYSSRLGISPRDYLVILAGLTEQLPDKVRVSTTHIGLVETGKRRVSLKTLQKIATALKVKTRDLLPF